ncbi:MAG: CotH kinase family protein, partial [Bacteroidetes bacterium]|nr:CotH kinase family protein [Bacteroidota bacterium]
SMMRSKIISDFLIEQNILAQRITYTRVTINGVYWCLYTMVEQLDKTFLSTNFADKSGNLYKALPKYPNWEPLGGSTLEYLGNLPSDYDKIYELKTNNLVNDWSRFVNLLDKINNTPQAEFKDSLEAIMYTDSYIKAWAAMSLFVNFDSYPWLGNNFYIYHRPGDNRFYWIAWDFNLGVGTARHGMSITQAQNVSVLYFSPGAAIRPLATRMLDDPYYYNRYLGWVCKFAQTAFDTTYLSPKIDSIADMIRTDLYADTNKFYNNAVFEDNLNYNIPGFPGLKPFIAKRRIAVLSELQTLGCPALVSIEPATTQNLSVIVYPNPFNNFATIEIQGIKDKWTWTLYNALGQAIQQVDDINDEQLTISKGTLSKGIYLYQVRTKNGMIGVGKLVVELILSIQ